PLGEDPPGGDAADGAGGELGDPEGAVRAGDDLVGGDGLPTTWRDGELGDLPPGGDASDLVRVLLGEPERAVGPERDPGQTGIWRGDTELGQADAGHEVADDIPSPFGEPDRLV